MIILKTLQIKPYEIEKYKSISRVSCNHQSQRPPPNSSAVETHARRDAEPPPMPDLSKHHRQQGFVSRLTGPLHAARHMSLWHVDWGTSPCCLGPRSITFHRQSRRRTIDQPSPDQHPHSRETTSSWPPAKAGDTSRNRSHHIWRTVRRPGCQSERSTSTYCHNSETPLWRSPPVWE
jgi:hypothetical protein